MRTGYTAAIYLTRANTSVAAASFAKTVDIASADQILTEGTPDPGSTAD